MSTDLNELNRLREMEDEVGSEKGISAETLRRMVAKVEEYSESHRADGLPSDLLNILKDDLDSLRPIRAKIKTQRGVEHGAPQVRDHLNNHPLLNT
jgi:hypothetical protein